MKVMYVCSNCRAMFQDEQACLYHEANHFHGNDLLKYLFKNFHHEKPCIVCKNVYYSYGCEQGCSKKDYLCKENNYKDFEVGKLSTGVFLSLYENMRRLEFLMNQKCKYKTIEDIKATGRYHELCDKFEEAIANNKKESTHDSMSQVIKTGTKMADYMFGESVFCEEFYICRDVDDYYERLLNV